MASFSPGHTIKENNAGSIKLHIVLQEIFILYEKYKILKNIMKNQLKITSFPSYIWY